MLIIGAKGFAKELFEVILQNGPPNSIAFYDDVSEEAPSSLFRGYQVLRNAEAAADYLHDTDQSFALAVGNPQTRQALFAKFVDLGGKPVTIISPFAKIGKIDNEIGDGCNILTNAVIESGNSIGKGCLIHVGALVSHDVVVGDFCEISPHANLLGGVQIGECCSIGTAAVILPRITVGNNCVVGAGAVVTKNVPDDTIVIGNPAKPLSK